MISRCRKHARSDMNETRFSASAEPQNHCLELLNAKVLLSDLLYDLLFPSFPLFYTSVIPHCIAQASDRDPSYSTHIFIQLINLSIITTTTIMKTAVASFALLILAQLTSAGPIQRYAGNLGPSNHILTSPRGDNVVRHPHAQPKRYVVNYVPSIQPIKARQFGGTVSSFDPEATPTKKGTEDGTVPAVGVGLPDNTSLLSLLTQTTVTPDTTSTSLFGQQPPQSQEATSTVSSSTDANAVNAGQSSILPIPATTLASLTSSFDPAAAAQTTTILAATTQTTTQEVTVVFITESATFSGSTAGFSTLTPASITTTISNSIPNTSIPPSSIPTIISITSSTPQIETITTTQTGPLISTTSTPAPAPSATTTQQEGDPSTTITLASQTTVVVAVAPSFASGSTISPVAATSLASAVASVGSGGVGPLGVVFTVSSEVGDGSVITVTADAVSTASSSQEAGFTTTIQTSLVSDAPLSVVPITPGVAVKATGVGGGVSTVTVTEVVTSTVTER